LNADKILHLVTSKGLVDFLALGGGEKAQGFVAGEEKELGGFFELFGAVNGFAHGAAEGDEAVVAEQETVGLAGGGADDLGEIL
jgi:hypothetical protein